MAHAFKLTRPNWLPIALPVALPIVLISALLLAACADSPTTEHHAGPVATRSGAQTISVPSDHASIQAAVLAADPGDIIVIAPGTYDEDVTLSTGVTLRGSGLDATTLYGTLTLDNVADVAVEALTLRGDLDPGAIGIDAVDAAFTLRNARVTDFASNIRVTGNATRTVTILRSFIERSEVAGLLLTGAAEVKLINSIFGVNEAHGVHATPTASGDVQAIHCLFWGNGWPSQGAALLDDSGTVVSLLNTIVTSNRRGLDCGAACSNAQSIIWGNFDDYTRNAAPGAGNISRDPMLADLSEGDFRLLEGSPAIDAGVFASPLAADAFGTQRPSGSAVDIGPYEFLQSVTEAIRITEVMANPLDERAGEFVELHNTGDADVDVSGWLLDDGDSLDTLVAWPGGDAVIPPGGFAVVLDPDFDPGAPTFAVATGATWLTVASSRTLGSGLSTGDPVSLHHEGRVVSSFNHPFDAGNGVSVELDSLDDGDTAGNWLASPCGASPGAANCVWSDDTSASARVVITEVMANPLTERSGEYIEVYNAGDDSVDLAGWVIDDGDSEDTLTGWLGGPTTLSPGSYAVIVDPDYTLADYGIASDATILTVTTSATLGNALSTNDPIALRDDRGAHIDAFGHPFDPGNGVSAERTSPAAADVPGSWRASRCETGGSPGSGACATTAPPAATDTIAITEVMANALNEDTGEFIELFNYGTRAVDLTAWQIDDGDKREPLRAVAAGTTMRLQPGAFALIMDSEYVEGTYAIGGGVLRLRTPDSSIASGLATTDPITLYDADGAVVASWSSPFNPGNGVSAEQVDLEDGDVASNWVASECGASPGARACGDTPTTTRALVPVGLVITEVMANPLDEGKGEFVELYNAGPVPISLSGLSISDGTSTDALQPYDTLSLDSTPLAPGEYAVIVDNDNRAANSDGPWVGSDGELWVTTDDKTIGNGLATGDQVRLLDAGGRVLSSYRHPFNPGNGWSAERVRVTGPDTADAWLASSCMGGSRGKPNCVATDVPRTDLPDGVPCPFGAVECAGGVCLVEAVTQRTLCASSCETSACGQGLECVATEDASWPRVCWPEGDGPIEPGPQSPRLLLTEVVVTPGAAEAIEIHNPGTTPVGLSDIYLADYPDYHGITTGSAGPNSADFRMRFPDGAQIAAGAYVTVSLESASHFTAEYGVAPDYDVVASNPGAPAMVGQIGGNAGLSNSGEMVVLFRWDGSSPLVEDLDYVVFGDNQAGMDKTGVTVGNASYQPEQRWLDQRAAPSPSTSGSVLARCDLAETGQNATGGNGGDGSDHTSEPFPETWQVSTEPSLGGPNAACAGSCTPSCSGNCGPDGCGGSCGVCGGDSYCEVDQCMPIATGLTLTEVRRGFGGFRLPAGLGETHTLAMFESAAAFQSYFGVAPPAEADFATEHVLFFSAGSHPLGAGNDATVTEVVDNTSELFVFTTRGYPEEDCITLSAQVPVWNMYTVTKPASGATTLTEIYGEEDRWCGTPGAGGNGASCGADRVCGPDFVCAGMSLWGDGFCNPKWMWGFHDADTSPVVPIPDGGQVTIPIPVSGMASVEVDVVLYVEITHPAPEQLTLTMLNPLNEDGEISQSVLIVDQVASGVANLLIHRPVIGFSGDEVANGEWALVVADGTAGQVGTVNALWMEMTSRWD